MLGQLEIVRPRPAAWTITPSGPILMATTFGSGASSLSRLRRVRKWRREGNSVSTSLATGEEEIDAAEKFAPLRDGPDPSNATSSWSSMSTDISLPPLTAQRLGEGGLQFGRQRRYMRVGARPTESTSSIAGLNSRQFLVLLRKHESASSVFLVEPPVPQGSIEADGRRRRGPIDRRAPRSDIRVRPAR